MILASRGWRVFATMRNLEKRTPLEQALKQTGVQDAVTIEQLDVTGPHAVFSCATTLLTQADGTSGYAVQLAAAAPGSVAASSGLALVATEALPEHGQIGTLLIPGGPGMRRASRDAPAFIDWLRRAALRADRVVSVCTGAFPLAATGQLDGIAATTHWQWARVLSDKHPAVQVNAEAIYLRQGRVWTSAGVTAGIDLALALVEADHGADLAQQIARELVVFVRRPGGQSQFAAPAWAPPAQRPAVRAAQDLIHGLCGAGSGRRGPPAAGGRIHPHRGGRGALWLRLGGDNAPRVRAPARCAARPLPTSLHHRWVTANHNPVQIKCEASPLRSDP